MERSNDEGRESEVSKITARFRQQYLGNWMSYQRETKNILKEIVFRFVLLFSRQYAAAGSFCSPWTKEDGCSIVSRELLFILTCTPDA